MVNWKFFWGEDLEEPFNVGENLTRSQDARLQKNIKLIKDFETSSHAFPNVVQTASVMCDTQDHSDD
jgi:hypothetical protein